MTNPITNFVPHSINPSNQIVPPSPKTQTPIPGALDAIASVEIPSNLESSPQSLPATAPTSQNTETPASSAKQKSKNQRKKKKSAVPLTPYQSLENHLKTVTSKFTNPFNWEKHDSESLFSIAERNLSTILANMEKDFNSSDEEILDNTFFIATILNYLSAQLRAFETRFKMDFEEELKNGSKDSYRNFLAKHCDQIAPFVKRDACLRENNALIQKHKILTVDYNKLITIMENTNLDENLLTQRYKKTLAELKNTINDSDDYEKLINNLRTSLEIKKNYPGKSLSIYTFIYCRILNLFREIRDQPKPEKYKTTLIELQTYLENLIDPEKIVLTLHNEPPQVESGQLKNLLLEFKTQFDYLKIYNESHQNNILKESQLKFINQDLSNFFDNLENKTLSINDFMQFYNKFENLFLLLDRLSNAFQATINSRQNPKYVEKFDYLTQHSSLKDFKEDSLESIESTESGVGIHIKFDTKTHLGTITVLDNKKLSYSSFFSTYLSSLDSITGALPTLFQKLFERNPYIKTDYRIDLKKFRAFFDELEKNLEYGKGSSSFLVNDYDFPFLIDDLLSFVIYLSDRYEDFQNKLKTNPNEKPSVELTKSLFQLRLKINQIVARIHTRIKEVILFENTMKSSSSLEVKFEKNQGFIFRKIPSEGIPHVNDSKISEVNKKSIAFLLNIIQDLMLMSKSISNMIDTESDFRMVPINLKKELFGFKPIDSEEEVKIETPSESSESDDSAETSNDEASTTHSIEETKDETPESDSPSEINTDTSSVNSRAQKIKSNQQHQSNKKQKILERRQKRQQKQLLSAPSPSAPQVKTKKKSSKLKDQCNVKELVKILLEKGYGEVRKGKGAHIIFRNNITGDQIPLSHPKPDGSIPTGTAASILSQIRSNSSK